MPVASLRYTDSPAAFAAALLVLACLAAPPAQAQEIPTQVPPPEAAAAPATAPASSADLEKRLASLETEVAALRTIGMPSLIDLR